MANEDEPIKKIPDSPWDNTFEGDYGNFLRLSGQEGKFLVIFLKEDPVKRTNPNYPKEEYHWDVAYIPDPMDPGVWEYRVVTESSKAFCTALKQIHDKGGLTGRFIFLQWRKEDRRGKEVKIWHIHEWRNPNVNAKDYHHADVSDVQDDH